jgi:peptide/nickel transport system permease protein
MSASVDRQIPARVCYSLQKVLSMGRYILKRLVISVPLLILISMLIFTLLLLTPGDPLDAYLPPDMSFTPEQRTVLRHQLGLDQPPVLRYFYWLGNTLTGNMGYRTKNFEPVSQAIATHMGPTVLLMGSALVIGIGLGIGLGVLSAIRQYSILDLSFTFLAFLGISLPAFLAGLLGLYFFSLKLKWFPSGGFSTPAQPVTIPDVFHHLILPASILSIFYVASILRYTRSAMLDVLGQDYVRVARSKGLDSRLVIFRHALRNALLPVITIIGANIANLLGGAVFIEAIFSWPGMGQLFVDGVSSRDYPLIMGMTLTVATSVLLVNLLTDVAYAVVDPRIRLSK